MLWLGRMRYDCLTVLQMLRLPMNRLLLVLMRNSRLLGNELRALEYLHYLITGAHHRILLNNRLRCWRPQLSGPSCRCPRTRASTRTTGCTMPSTPNDDAPTQATVATGSDQNRSVWARNRTGTGDWASNEGDSLCLLLLLLLLVVLDMLLQRFFRRFRATGGSADCCPMSMTCM